MWYPPLPLPHTLTQVLSRSVLSEAVRVLCLRDHVCLSQIPTGPFLSFSSRSPSLPQDLSSLPMSQGIPRCGPGTLTSHPQRKRLQPQTVSLRSKKLDDDTLRSTSLGQKTKSVDLYVGGRQPTEGAMVDPR